MWLCILLCKRFEDTFENTQWGKVQQMQPVWLRILSGRRFEKTFKDASSNSCNFRRYLKRHNGEKQTKLTPFIECMTSYCPSQYISFLLGVTDRLPNQRRARDVITPERKEIQLSLWVLMWKMRAGLERDNRESCFCTKRATFACTIGQSLQQLGFYSTWFPRDKGGFS